MQLTPAVVDWMTMEVEGGKVGASVRALMAAGAHFAYSRSKRHPSAKPYLFGVKNNVEIFDVEKTAEFILRASQFLATLVREKKTILFVGTKPEAKEATQAGGESLGMPYVVERWIGGTLTNFSEVRKRVDKLLELTNKRAAGEFAKYTKREQLLIEREIARLQKLFSGIIPLIGLPAALFIVDPKWEKTAIAEARRKNIPVVALASSDCNLTLLQYPIPANDASRSSIEFIVGEVVKECLANNKEGGGEEVTSVVPSYEGAS